MIFLAVFNLTLLILGMVVIMAMFQEEPIVTKPIPWPPSRGMVRPINRWRCDQEDQRRLQQIKDRAGL